MQAGKILAHPGGFGVVMKCANHPDRDAVVACADCGKGICYYCKTTFEEKAYCPSCIEEILNKPSQKTGIAKQRKDRKKIGVEEIPDISIRKADRKLFRNKLREGQISVNLIGAEPPVVLKRGEELRVVLPNISLIEPRSVRTGRAFYGGPSIRVAKGIRLRTGMVKGRGESHEELRNIDQGILTLTTKRLIFSGEKNSLTIALTKIVSMEPFKDGVAIRREDRQKTQYFSGINPEIISIEAKIDDRQYEEPFTGEILKYLIEGTIKQQVQLHPAKGKTTKETISAIAPSTSALSIPDKIKKLAELKDAGILTSEEFENKKSELLSRM